MVDDDDLDQYCVECGVILFKGVECDNCGYWNGYDDPEDYDDPYGDEEEE